MLHTYYVSKFGRLYANISRRFYASVTVNNNASERKIALTWKDREIKPKTSEYHHVWLRDNCPCAKCLEASSRQKLVPVRSQPENPTIVQANIEKESLRVKWNDDHSSEYPIPWLRENSYSPAARSERRDKQLPLLWEGNDMHAVPTFEYDDYMEEPRELYALLQCIAEFGIAVIRNVPCKPLEVLKVAEKIGYIRETFYGREFDVISLPNPVNIAYSHHKLDLHQDLCYYESPPGVQLLHSLEFSVKGGETFFADGFKIAQDFGAKYPDKFEALKSLPITFHYNRKDHYLRFRRPVIVTDEEDPQLITQLYYSPPFEGPLDIHPDKVEEFYSAYRLFSQMVEDPAYKWHTKLNPGTLVMFNNRRILHGRESFDPNSGKRHLQGTYLEMDIVADRLRILAKSVDEDAAAGSPTVFHLGNSPLLY